MASDQRSRRARLTARAIVLHRGRVLLLRAEDPGRTWYFLPGGHVEHGERLEDACAREVLEETGLRVKIGRPLYLREFIAARHKRRSVHMPEHHHAAGLVFLCSLHETGEKDFEKLGRFDPESDGATGVVAMEWIPLEKIEGIEIMPPQLRLLLMKDFPPPPERGIEFWPEE